MGLFGNDQSEAGVISTSALVVKVDGFVEVIIMELANTNLFKVIMLKRS